MIKKFTVTSILVLVTCLVGFNAFSQCGATAFNEGTVAVGCNGFGASVNISSTAFRTFNVTNGVVYSISTCGSAWDSQISVKDNSNVQKAYNDDNGPACSGAAASVDWTADYTGTARAFVHRYNCGATWPGSSAVLQVRQNSTVANTTSNATICTYQTKALTYTVSSGTGVPTWAVVAGSGSIAGTTFTPSAAGSVTVRATLGVCTSDVTFTVSAPTGNPAVFGNGTWNVYAYNAGDAGGGSGAWTNNYSGFYTENNLGFVTTTRWINSPSEANAASGAAYAGCPVNADNHSWSAKRTNIPCGVYQIQVQHDDIGQIFINGTNVYNNAVCCATTNAGTFVIAPSDNVEYRVSEGGGGSDGTIAFNNAFTALNAGSITYGGSLTGCINFDPPAFGNGGDASGGASATVTNGSTTYQWQVNGGNILGATAATYDAPAIPGPGTYIYRRIVTDRCGNTAITNTFTITIASNNTVGGASSSPNVCINTAITSVTHATTGATGIGAASGLPAGVTAAWASNTITISGTPSAVGTFNYTIPLTGGCGAVNATGTIIVRANNTVGAASSSPSVCINTAITSVTHATTGATGIGAASGLPAGVTASWASNTITISGTPSAVGTFNYTIPLTGGCGAVNATGTITVTANNTVGAASSSPNVCINTAITSVTHATTGATGIGAASGLPAGVTAAWASNTITISGTPSAVGTFNYTIPLTGGCGAVNATGTITVTANNTVGAASSSPNVCINTAITSVTHATTGATGIGGASGLPAGVTASWASNTITISGTPSAVGTFNYTIPLTGGCGSVNATGTITVRANNTVGAASSSPIVCINAPITSVTHATTGATGIGATLGLPAGVTAAWASNTITISGTPSIAGTFNYTIPLTGGCGSVNATGTITVNGRPSPTFISVDPTVNVCSGTNVTYTTQLGQSNYVWSIPGIAGVDYQLVSGGNSSSNTAVISWRAAGSGTVVSVNYENGLGCAAISPTNSSAVVLPSAASALSSNGQSATCRVNGSNKVDFVNGVNLLLSLRSSAGVDLGDITATSYVGGTSTVQACGTSAMTQPQFTAAYLGRRWVVRAPFAPASPAVEATLPFTTGELSSLATVSNTVTTANPLDDVNASNNGSDLILVKYTSLSEDGDPTNNCGSGTTVAVTGPVTSSVFGNPTVQYNFTGFSEWYLHGASIISPLPIVLTSFTAACDAGEVKLDWITATEINNDKFIITRSADMLVWDEVATLSGAGNSNQPLYYTTTDARPISGLSYYRLTQRDYDGTTETFAPISVTCYTDGNGNSMMVYPNPADDQFTVSVTLTDACDDCSIEIYDINGKRIALRNVSMGQGENTYTFDRASMNPGQYIIQLKSGNFIVKPAKLIMK